MLKTKKSFTVILIAVLALFLFAIPLFGSREPDYETATDAQKTILDFAEANGVSYSDYPESLVSLLERNPETAEFVLNYPLSQRTVMAPEPEEYAITDSVPLFLQWDPRWGYMQYGSDMAAITGCGPVCLSMAACYLTGDAKFVPDKLIRFASENGYYVKGSGSSWTLISEGGPALGFDVRELPLDENVIQKNLEAGYPVICVLGPGDFTTSGHFIVLTGWENGAFRVNDPNSRANSAKLWDYSRISGQIRNLWVIRN